MSDAILARVAAGDPRAIDECLARYSGLVWSLARRYSANASDAEDAVQEIFIDLWRSAGRFDSRVAAEATFVAMVSRRRLIDRRRKQSTGAPTTSLERAAAVATEDEAPNRIETNEEAAKIREQLQKLRPEERRVLELSICEGLSQSQISERTALPLGTVKTHARRGLSRLRELVAEYWPAGKGGAR